MNTSVEPRSRVAGHEEPVFDRVAELERQLRHARAELARRDQEVHALRRKNAEAMRRSRQRQGEEGRRKATAYKREYRARKRREHGS